MKTRFSPVSREEALRQEALDEVRAIYRELDSRPVDRACTRLGECCAFRLTGRTPMLTHGEAMLVAKAFRAKGRKALPDRADGACPMLRETGGCLIYADRPFGCRTHFCAAAGGPYARGEVLDLIRRLEAVDSLLGGDGPRGLATAVAAEL
jgi:Fe-S-cluster containining protein